MLTSVEGNAVQATELETSARTESKRITNHNTPQLSRMDLANHCAAFPGLSLLNTRAVFRRDSPPTWSRRSTGSDGESSSMLTSVEGNAVQGRMLL
jgi:hypothetical protein